MDFWTKNLDVKPVIIEIFLHDAKCSCIYVYSDSGSGMYKGMKILMIPDSIHNDGIMMRTEI